MDNFKRFLTFSRSERIAIITIVALIVIVLITKYLTISNPPKRDYFKHDLDSIIARREMILDSIAQAEIAEKAEKARQRDSSFQAKRSVVKKSSAKRIDKTRQVTNQDSVGRGFLDLNTADTTLLKQLPGIGSAFAKWIVEYRTKLGGYCESEQLLEVYRMDTTRYNAIADLVKIDSTFIPNKLKINSDAFKVLLKHPYLQYDDVKKIVNHREQRGLITSWGQLETIVGDAINPKLRYYIDYQ